MGVTNRRGKRYTGVVATMGGIEMMPVERVVSPPLSADVEAEVVALFEQHGTALYRFCHGMLGSRADAQDVVQETFLKLLGHLRTGGDHTNVRAWLFAVAANACRDRMRQRRRWLPWRVELDVRTVEPAGDTRDVACVRAAWRRLSPRDRMLLSLRAQGLSYREIGVAAGIRESSVGRLLARAVDRIKRKLDRTGS
jgi:RNA polymerase sigma-70 factor, ECF subfamily